MASNYLNGNLAAASNSLYLTSLQFGGYGTNFTLATSNLLWQFINTNQASVSFALGLGQNSTNFAIAQSIAQSNLAVTLSQNLSNYMVSTGAGSASTVSNVLQSQITSLGGNVTNEIVSQSQSASNGVTSNLLFSQATASNALYQLAYVLSTAGTNNAQAVSNYLWMFNLTNQYAIKVYAATGAVASAQFASNVPASGSVALGALQGGGASGGQTIVWSGSAWTTQYPSNISGTISNAQYAFTAGSAGFSTNSAYSTNAGSANYASLSTNAQSAAAAAISSNVVSEVTNQWRVDSINAAVGALNGYVPTNSIRNAITFNVDPLGYQSGLSNCFTTIDAALAAMGPSNVLEIWPGSLLSRDHSGDELYSDARSEEYGISIVARRIYCTSPTNHFSLVPSDYNTFNDLWLYNASQQSVGAAVGSWTLETNGFTGVVFNRPTVISENTGFHIEPTIRERQPAA